VPVQVINFSEEQVKAAVVMACGAQVSVDALMACVEALKKEQLNRGEPNYPPTFCPAVVVAAHTKMCPTT